MASRACRASSAPSEARTRGGVVAVEIPLRRCAKRDRAAKLATLAIGSTGKVAARAFQRPFSQGPAGAASVMATKRQLLMGAAALSGPASITNNVVPLWPTTFQ